MSEKNVGIHENQSVDERLMSSCGDLIDLGNRGNGIVKRHTANPSNIVEAINSQLLAEISERSLHQQHEINKLNYNIDSTVAPTPASSSSDPIETNNNTNNNNSHEHQTAIREFKRLGTYCTLRPEQRRKHLLKVLPTLRNSMLFQTLLDASTNRDSSNLSQKANTVDELRHTKTTPNDIDSILIDLDDFIIDGSVARHQRNRPDEMLNTGENITSTCKNFSQNKLNGSSVSILAPGSGNHSDIGSCSTSNVLNCINIDPDKVEDCLLELDAYLEEIDREYASTCLPSAHNTTLTADLPRSQKQCDDWNSNNNDDNNNSNSNVKSPKIYTNHLRNFHMENLATHSPECNDESILSNRTKRYHSQLNLNKEDCMNKTVYDYCYSIGVSQRQSPTNTKLLSTNLRKTISNSDIQMNRYKKLDYDDGDFDSIDDNGQINGSRSTNNPRKSTNHHQQMKRGHKLRNTIAVPQKIRYSIERSDSRSSLHGKI